MIIEDKLITIKSKKSINILCRHLNIDTTLKEIKITAFELIKHLPNSRIKINFKCDRCGSCFKSACCTQTLSNQLCKSCKIKHTNLERYGVENVFQSKEIKSKIKETLIKSYGVDNVSKLNSVKNKKKQTCFKNYNVEYPSQSKEIREKIINTNIEKYGVDNVSKSNKIKMKKQDTCLVNFGTHWPGQSIIIKNKIKKTLIKNYGVENPGQSMEIRKKIINTNLERYGVKNVFQSKEVKDKIKQTLITNYGVDNPLKSDAILQKVMISFHKNGTGPCSKQQKHICKLFNGELNYPINKYMLDIAFPSDMVYIEYNGGGHYAFAQNNGLTLKEIEQRDIKRYYMLKKHGWKIIKIISKKDKMLQDNKFISLINEAKNYLLSTNHTWVTIDIDNNEYSCTEYTKNI